MSHAETKAIVLAHNLLFSDFLADVGDRAQYLVSDVLNWLGY